MPGCAVRSSSCENRSDNNAPGGVKPGMRPASCGEKSRTLLRPTNWASHAWVMKWSTCSGVMVPLGPKKSHPKFSLYQDCNSPLS